MPKASWATFHRVFTYSMVAKSIKATFSKIFSYAMLSGASNTTLQKVFTVEYCLRRCSWDNIAQTITPVQCCRRSSKQYCTSKNPIHCCSIDSR